MGNQKTLKKQRKNAGILVKYEFRGYVAAGQIWVLWVYPASKFGSKWTSFSPVQRCGPAGNPLEKYHSRLQRSVANPQ